MNIASFWPSAPLLVEGLGTTLLLSVLSALFGTALGGLAAAARHFRVPVLSQIATLYVQVFRGSPLLITLMFVYFGMASFGINVDVFVAAIIGLSVYSGAFIGEIIRSGLEAVPVSQWEAASILGLHSGPTFFRVILPQASRVAFPPLVGQYIALIKDSSLAFMIGVVELMKRGQSIVDRIGEPLIVYGAVAILYFIVCYPLSIWVRRIEQRRTL